MTENRELPQNVLQATGQVAGDVVGGLKNSPMLLAIIVLNVIGIALAGYLGMQFLATVERGDTYDRQVLEKLMENNRQGFMTMLNMCFPERTRGMPQFDPRDRREDRQ